jgi:hypothetical protein
LCLDKKAGDCLRALAGLAIEVKAIPIANAQVRNGKVEATNNGELVSMFAKYLKMKKIEKVDANIARNFCQSNGQQPERYSYLLRKAQEYGVVKKIGTGKASTYKVIQGGK